jgi:hypothetical protein
MSPPSKSIKIPIKFHDGFPQHKSYKNATFQGKNVVINITF